MKILSRQEYYEERKKSTSPECVLCHQKQLVLGETKYWRWIAARAPYWKYHTMIVPKRHFVELYEINDEEWNELKKLEKKIIRIYKSVTITDESTGNLLENVLVFFRQRLNLHNPILNAQNLDHLHIHFTFDKDHFLDPISDENATEWDTKIFKNKLKI